ncbi:hypothetical protein UFOVP413_45 [uncultured Caudovirales phage]|uniref:Uncharacterized protein n=1 Tax=uncultured Caudovirales phage TaxID=2100421 RepID=A0A6J5M4G7_9CAUD|nr:hypothetical protein UFOVP413_45 [uncultured Caudovirales phage]
MQSSSRSIPLDSQKRVLQEAAKEFQQIYQFTPGDFVRMKKCFQVYNRPLQHELCVVLELIADAVRLERADDSVYAGFINDMRIGIFHENYILPQCVDSRMFEPDDRAEKISTDSMAARIISMFGRK